MSLTPATVIRTGLLVLLAVVLETLRPDADAVAGARQLHDAADPCAAALQASFDDVIDTEQLADRAAPAVAADEVPRAQLFPAGQLDGHTVVVLREPGHRAAAPDLRAQLGRVFFQEAFEDRFGAAPERIVLAPDFADLVIGIAAAN